MKEERKKNIYIKIIYMEPLLISYTLENTVIIIDDMLNIRNLI